MKVEVWSDIACPFCYIGKRKFEEALKLFDHKTDVQTEFKSFQLDPAAKKDSGQSIHDVLAAKYGVSVEQAKGMHQQMTQQAKEVGLDYHFDTLIPTNTMDAHRLIHFAKEQGKMEEMKERLLKAYFTDSIDIGDHNNLANLAEEAGLDKEQSLAILTEGKYRDEVINDHREAEQLGVQGVPFFVFNRKYAVSGAQNPETFSEVLEKLWQEENPQTQLEMLNENDSDDQCGDDSCSI